MESKDDYPGKQWQPIFDYMVDTFDLSLTLKEMEELIKGVSIAIGHTALQSKCERYERALKKISHTSIVVGQPGSTWCDTDLDSVAVAAGYNQALDNIIPIANEALAWDGKKEVELSCMVCGAAFMGPEPKGCCSGRDCGCMGMPTEPIVCSEECYDNLPGVKNKKEGGQ